MLQDIVVLSKRPSDVALQLHYVSLCVCTAGGSGNRLHKTCMTFLLSSAFEPLLSNCFVNQLILWTGWTWNHWADSPWCRTAAECCTSPVDLVLRSFPSSASISDVLCWWRTEQMNIHECADSFYVSQWFPAVSSRYANCFFRSPYGHASPYFFLINEAEQMFFFQGKSVP